MKEQRIYQGKGSISSLSSLLKELQVRRIFLLTGKRSYTQSGAEQVLSSVLGPYEVVRFSDFKENPQLEDVERGVALFRKSKFDIILAIGGGSVIDMAKLISLFSVQSQPPLSLLDKQELSQPAAVPVIAVPTTAGTGTEATHFAVLYVNKRKYSVAHPSLLPSYAFLDAQFTFTLPPYITASTGMDAFAQAIESYWSVNSTDVSRYYASDAIKLVINHLVDAVQRPTPTAREAMLSAAHLAGKAIDITRTTAPHAVSYALTAYFGVPHGHAVALTLGEFFEYNGLVSEEDVADSRGVAHVRHVISELLTLLGKSDLPSCKRMINDLMARCGLARTLRACGVLSEKDLRFIVDNVNVQRLANNPRHVTNLALLKILRNIF